MLRARSVCIAAQAKRSFSSTVANQLFKRKANEASANGSIFKRGTPQKSRGWISNWKETTAYSGFAKEAPKVKVNTLSLKSLEGGKIVEYPSKVAKGLGVFGSYKLGQRHELFKSKTTLVRDSTTIPVAEFIKTGAETSSDNNRLCLTGDQGTGKSSLLAQAQALALLNKYIVLAIPRARELVSGDSDAVWNEKHQHFTQPMYVRQWIKRIARGNKDALSQLPTPETESKHAATTTLLDYMLANKNSRDVHEVLENIMHVLTTQTQFPVLLTLDDLNIFTEFVNSKNVDVKSKPIYHGDLQMPKLFLDFLAGRRQFAKGAVIASLSGANKINETITAGLGFHPPTAYARIDQYDERLANSLKGVRPLEVPRYTLDETRASLKYWSEAKVISQEITETFASEKYFVSGNGNPRELLVAATQLY